MAKKSKPKSSLKTDLISTTVHELKSPLTLINGIASMLSEGDFGKLNTEQKKYISRISMTSERLLTVIDSLLTIGKVQHNRLSPRMNPVSMLSLVRQATVELEPFLTQKRINLSIYRKRKSQPVLADKDLLYQVIYNLIDNAIKYSKPGSDIKIKITDTDQGQELHIRDEGVGVAPSEIEKIFEQFGTSKQPVQAHAGSSGLGLFIAKNLLDIQGGEIGVASLKDGSCFHITMPRVKQMSLFEGEIL